MARKPMISLIAAVAANGVIGDGNKLLWHLPEDMRHFRETTRGKPVIMGRKTWESLPDSFRPLPGRKNIVISRNRNYDAPGATLSNSLAEAIRLVEDMQEIFIIGGAQIYAEALALADRLYLTEIDAPFAGDASFPEVSPADWNEIERRQPDTRTTPAFSFAVYERRNKRAAA